MFQFNQIKLVETLESHMYSIWRLFFFHLDVINFTAQIRTILNPDKMLSTSITPFLEILQDSIELLEVISFHNSVNLIKLIHIIEII